MDLRSRERGEAIGSAYRWHRISGNGRLSTCVCFFPAERNTCRAPLALPLLLPCFSTWSRLLLFPSSARPFNRLLWRWLGPLPTAQCFVLCFYAFTICTYRITSIKPEQCCLFFSASFFFIETNWFFQFITSRRCSFLANDCSQIKRNNCTADLVSHTLKKPPFALFPPVYSTAAPIRIVSRVRTRISTDG